MTKVHDVFTPEVIAEVELAYYELSDAQYNYKACHARGVKEGSIMLTINNESTPHIDASVELTVKDAESLAYKILGLSAAVKND